MILPSSSRMTRRPYRPHRGDSGSDRYHRDGIFPTHIEPQVRFLLLIMTFILILRSIRSDSLLSTRFSYSFFLLRPTLLLLRHLSFSHQNRNSYLLPLHSPLLLLLLFKFLLISLLLPILSPLLPSLSHSAIYSPLLSLSSILSFYSPSPLPTSLLLIIRLLSLPLLLHTATSN